MNCVYKVYEVKIKMLATRAMATAKNEVFIVYWVYCMKIVIYVMRVGVIWCVGGRGESTGGNFSWWRRIS